MCHCVKIIYLTTFPAEKWIAYGTGRLLKSLELQPGQESMAWFGGNLFVFDAPCVDNLAVLANTAAGSDKNNARYVRTNRPTPRVKVS